MLFNIIKQFNWVDIFIVIVLLRICYIGIKNGFPAESFKLFGTILSVYLSLHYFTTLSDALNQQFHLKKMPIEFLDFLSFIFCALIGYGLFIGLRFLLSRFMKMEAVPQLNKWGGFALSFIRGFLLVGIIAFALVISSVGYLKNSVAASYSGKRMFKIAPAVYTWVWKNLMSRFMLKEKFNDTVTQIQEKFSS